MKKILLSMLAASAVFVSNAQRLVLYEEFSGENCGPCAAYNPGLLTLLTANSAKTILLKYQSPIPSAGPIYNQYTTPTDARLTYYSVPFAPYGRQDGVQVGDGNIANHTQAAINTAYALPTPFSIVATHSWSPDGTTITINVAVTSSGAFAGTNMKLRAALVEHLVYDTPPGTNGEMEFHNVMRQMYPDAAGTTISNTWTAQTQNYVLTGTVPAYVDKSDPGTFVILWLQDDANKVVAQAGKTVAVPLTLDVKSDGLTVADNFDCTATTSAVTPVVTIKNTGATPLTSADIYTKTTGAWTLAQSWTGTLAAGATQAVNLPAMNLAPGATYYIQDSVAMPNGSADVNLANNWSYGVTNIYNTTTNTLAITTGFENAGTLPNNYINYDVNGNGDNWVLASGTGNIGHNNSKYVIYHNNYQYAANEANLAIIPSADLASTPIRTLDFWVAYATYATEADKLEVVYSTNCGTSWTTVWTQQGTPLQTAPVTTSPFVPTQAQWKMKSVNMNSVPAGAIIAFRGTSAFGNNLFIDDINLRSGAPDPAGVEEFNNASSNMSLYPNPTTANATLTFTLDNSSDVQVQVLDAVGRLVSVVANGSMEKGPQEFTINTANLTSGMYNVVVKTSTGTLTQRLTVAK